MISIDKQCCSFYCKNIIKLVLVMILFVFTSCTSYKKLPKEDLIKDSDFKHYITFSSYLWSKNENNSLVIHKKNFRKVCRKPWSPKYDYFSTLKSYSFLLSINKKEIVEALSFSEKAKVLGYSIEYLYRCQKEIAKQDSIKQLQFIYRTMRLQNNDNTNYNREFKAHNYYGLKYLKEEHLKHYKVLPNLDTITVRSYRITP